MTTRVMFCPFESLTPFDPPENSMKINLKSCPEISVGWESDDDDDYYFLSDLKQMLQQRKKKRKLTDDLMSSICPVDGVTGR